MPIKSSFVNSPEKAPTRLPPILTKKKDMNIKQIEDFAPYRRISSEFDEPKPAIDRRKSKHENANSSKRMPPRLPSVIPE
jgi:hypothetical protein